MIAPSRSNPAAYLRPVLRPRSANTAGRLLHRADGGFSPYIYIALVFLLFISFGLLSILYRELIADDYFWNAVKRTSVLMCSGPQLVLALILAHLLTSVVRLRPCRFSSCSCCPADASSAESWKERSKDDN